MKIEPNKRLLISSGGQTIIIVVTSTVAVVAFALVAGYFGYKKYFKEIMKTGVKESSITSLEIADEKMDGDIRKESGGADVSRRRRGGHRRVHNPVFDTANVKKKIVKVFSEDDEIRPPRGRDKDLRVIIVDFDVYNKEAISLRRVQRRESEIRGRVRVDGGGYNLSGGPKQDELGPKYARYMSNRTVNKKVMNLDLREVSLVTTHQRLLFL